MNIHRNVKLVGLIDEIECGESKVGNVSIDKWLIRRTYGNKLRPEVFIC